MEKENPIDQTGKLNAVIDNGLQTYTSLGGSTGDVSRAIIWNAGDEVRFLAIANSSEIQDLGAIAAEDINGINANFIVTPPVSLTNYVALYPAANFAWGTGINNEKVSLTIPLLQTYVADGIPDDTYPMIAVGTISPLRFKGSGGVLRFEVTGEAGTTIDKIVFRSAGVNMTGMSDWIDPLSYVAGSKLRFTTTNACDSVVLSCPSVALSSTPVSFYIVVADTVYPAATTEICIEGSFGRKIFTASQSITATSNRISARSLFYGSYDMQRDYDAHFIIGDTLESGADFLNATVAGGGNWLTLSVNASYKESEQTQNYAGNVPLFIHLDENLTGSERSALITATRSDATILKVLVKQQSAVYVGPFGNYGGVSMGGPSEGSLDDSGQATPFSMQLRSGGGGYTKKMYVEAMPEYVSSGVQFASSSVSSYSGSNKHLGWGATKSSFDQSKYSTYGSLLYQSSAYPAIDYCASKNRDTNGDGVLNDDEIKWYMPAVNQSVGMWITDIYRDNSIYSWNTSASYWTTTKGTNIYNISYLTGSYSDAGVSGQEYYGVRCVRDGEDISHIVAYTDMSGYSMIDLSVLPTGVTTDISKGIAMGDEQSEMNQTIHKILRVAKKDSKQDGTGGYEEMSWSKAVGLSASFDNNTAVNELSASGTGCAVYYEENDASDKGLWRLPTQREMQSIWMWKDELENLSGFENFNSNGNGYWTATELKASPAKAFAVSLHSAYSEAVLKTGTHPVRCVREPLILNPGSSFLSLQYVRDTIVFVGAYAEVWGFTVLSNVTWTASSDQSWCTVLTTSGSGNGAVNFQTEQNNSISERRANITVTNGNQTIIIVVEQGGTEMVGNDGHYTTLEIEALPFVKVSSDGRSLVNGTTEEMMMTDVVIYVYKTDVSGTYPQMMCYVPSVNSNSATISFRGTVNSGMKKIFVAANTGASNPIVYNNDAIETVMYIGATLEKTFSEQNHILASTASGFQIQPFLDLSSGSEGNGSGLIKTVAGGSFDLSNGLLNTMTSYTNSTRFFMSNWDGPDISVSGAEKQTSDCAFTFLPDISLESSQNSPIGTNNHFKIGLQRGAAKISFRITANGTSVNETSGYEGPYYSSGTDGSKGRFMPWKMNGKAVWALGGINKHMYPFQSYQAGVVASPNYHVALVDDSDEWYAAYDNTRVFGTGKKHGTASFGFSDMKNAILSSGNYTPLSNADGNGAIYSFCTENAVAAPQLHNNSTFVVVGGEYRPENWISDVKRNSTIGNAPYYGWNGSSAIVGTPDVYGSTYTEPTWDDDEDLYFVKNVNLFIHGKRNLYAYYAYEVGVDISCEESQLLTNSLISNRISTDKNSDLISSYNRGQCIYKAFIQDRSSASMEDRILIRRNFIYDVNLVSIKNPEEAVFE